MQPTKKKTTTKSLTTTTQDKFLNTMADLADKYGLEFIHNPDYPNTGEVRFEIKGSFRSVFGFRYTFQNDSGVSSFVGINTDDNFRWNRQYSDLDAVVEDVGKRLSTSSST